MAKSRKQPKSSGQPASGAKPTAEAKSEALGAKDLDKVTGGYQSGGHGH